MFERNRIAETLRNAREKQGLSLEQAAASASIPLQYVRLLEGETNVRVGVSDELYLIPFFRKYARFVGLDAEQLLPEFLGVVQQLPGDVAPPIRLTYRPRFSFLWRPALVVSTVAIAAVLMLRQGPSQRASEEHVADEEHAPNAVMATVGPAASPGTVAPDAASPAAASDATPAAVVVAAAGVAPDSPPARPGATTAPTPTPAERPSGARELRIAAGEETWFSLAVDGQPTKQYVLRAGESRTWIGDGFNLTVGNAGGISLTLDGRELPPLGRTGQVVRNLRLPAAAPTPTPAA